MTTIIVLSQACPTCTRFRQEVLPQLTFRYRTVECPTKVLTLPPDLAELRSYVKRYPSILYISPTGTVTVYSGDITSSTELNGWAATVGRRN